MRKLLFASLFTLLFILSGCITVNLNTDKTESLFKNNKRLYDSVMQVENDLKYTICDIKKGELKNCQDKVTDYSVGTAFAFSFDAYKSDKIATAGHICKMSEMSKARLQIRAMMAGKMLMNMSYENLEITTDGGKKYKVKMIKGVNNSKSKIDACLLDAKKRFPSIQMSKTPPKRSQRYFSLGHPLGIKGEELTIQQSGLYSGHKESWDFYSIPSTGGSSGSPILNKDGKLVGIVSRGPRSFKEITLSTQFSKLHFWYSEVFSDLD